jgi:bacterial/archaeal transporter family-2 protein
MKASLLAAILAVLAGIGLPTQAGINAQLSLWTRSSVTAALISFAVGTLALGIAAMATMTPLPLWSSAAALPWWIWSGGVMGAFFVAASTFIAPQLGATTMLALILAGQIVASVLFDHFGVLGYPLHPLNLQRSLGLLLLIAGVVLIRNS